MKRPQITSNQLKNLIVTRSRECSIQIHIQGWSLAVTPKKWKRQLKRRCVLRDLEKPSRDGVLFSTNFTVQNYLCDGVWDEGKVYRPDELSPDTVVTAREFYWIDNEDRDTTVTFLTDATDSYIIATALHID